MLSNSTCLAVCFYKSVSLGDVSTCPSACKRKRIDRIEGYNLRLFQVIVDDWCAESRNSHGSMAVGLRRFLKLIKVLRRAQQFIKESRLSKILMRADEVIWHEENEGTTWGITYR